MKRNVPSKISVLDCRHPGLRNKLHGMFEEFWPAREVERAIESRYGESLSLRSIARYKSAHWQAQRELVQSMHTALQEARRSVHLFIASSGRCSEL